MNLVLIGYRGTGKSSVARLLAARLGRPVFSTDAEVVGRTNRSIPEIVKEFGWEYFRDVEAAVCRDLSGKDGLIVDTGGGAILRKENVEALKKNGILFWLTAQGSTIEARIGKDHQRPSLTGVKSFIEEIEEVLQERLPKYRAAADHVIPTDGRSLSQVADAILVHFQAANG
jgi:shikimate kinase